MQLTDSEIREIIRQKKLKKRRRQMMMMRAALAVVLLLLIVTVIAAVSANKDKDNKQEEAAEPEVRGIIFLDPGHGGSDPGSEADDRYEKDDTLTFALAVRTCLEDEGFDVVMSRDSDEYVERSERSTMANKAGAQLMVSIHRNKSQGDGEGVEIYIPMADTKESRLLADNIMAALAEAGFEERTVRAGTLNSSSEDYDELTGLKMPACLVEVGFISSEDDNLLFDNSLNANANAFAGAIIETFKSLYETDGDGTGSDDQASESEDGSSTDSE